MFPPASVRGETWWRQDQEQRREVTRLLVRRITIHTEFLDEGRRKKKARAVVEYRFPAVVNNHTGTRAGNNYNTVQRVVAL